MDGNKLITFMKDYRASFSLSVCTFTYFFAYLLDKHPGHTRFTDMFSQNETTVITVTVVVLFLGALLDKYRGVRYYNQWSIFSNNPYIILLSVNSLIAIPILMSVYLGAISDIAAVQLFKYATLLAIFLSLICFFVFKRFFYTFSNVMCPFRSKYRIVYLVFFIVFFPFFIFSVDFYIPFLKPSEPIKECYKAFLSYYIILNFEFYLAALFFNLMRKVRRGHR